MLILAVLLFRRARPLLALALMAALGTACSSDDNPEAGILVVPYELGNQRDCSSLGVKVIRAELDDPMYVEEATCDAGAIRFQQVPPGSYKVRLFGVDRSGIAIMDSLASGDVPVSVVGDGTTVIADPAVTLTAAPAHLLMRWDFGFGTCDSAAIDRFAITAWRADGSALLLDTKLECNTLGEGAEQYRSVPDLDRELAGDEVGEVAIQPLDKNGSKVGDAITYNFEEPGAGRFVKLSVECDNGGCNGSGTPDSNWGSAASAPAAREGPLLT
jgi:hypothetical protein